MATDPLTGLELRGLPVGAHSVLYVVRGDEVRVLAVLASVADIESRVPRLFDGLRDGT